MYSPKIKWRKGNNSGNACGQKERSSFPWNSKSEHIKAEYKLSNCYEFVQVCSTLTKQYTALLNWASKCFAPFVLLTNRY